MKKIFKLLINGFSILLFGTFSSGLSYAEVSFLAMGDSPYSDEGYYLIEKELKNIPTNIQFVIHLGDIKPKEKKCTERDYRDFRDLLKQSSVPIFVIPGDNGYDVCENKLKAKQFWDQYIFEFEKHWKLEFLVSRQIEQKENFSFLLESTLFVGVNLFEKRDRDNIEFSKILKNNISWIKENLKVYEEQTKFLVIFAHDFSGIRNESDDYIVCRNKDLSSWAKENYESKKYFSEQLTTIASTFNKPILYMQGNHHCWTHDFPYKGTKNIERIVVDKIEKTPLVKITIEGDKIKVNQRKDKRIDFFIKDANLGNVWSQYFLGKEYLKIKDYKNAKKWFTKASNKKFSPAMLELGINFREEKKYANSLSLFLSAIEDQVSNKELIQKQNNEKPLLLYQKKIIQFKKETVKQSKYRGNFYVGLSYFHGLGVPVDYSKALKYFKKAGVFAYYNIALIYKNGLGVQQDFKESKKWCIKAASHGVLKCNSMIGIFYLMGQGVDKDYKESAKWFKRARDHAPSLYNLSLLYLNGLGVEKNQEKAIEYLKKSALKGYPAAVESLELLKKLKVR